MNEWMTHIGVGGIFAILVIREVLNFIKPTRTVEVKKDVNGKAVLCVSRDEFETHKSHVQYKDNCVQIVKRIDENFLERKRDMDKRFDKVESCLGELKLMVGQLHGNH
jgi:hypothetical protein